MIGTARAGRAVWASFGLFFLVVTASPAIAQAPDATLARVARSGDAADLLDEISRTVGEQFFDKNFNGADWPALVAAYRPQILAAPDLAERSRLVNRMLDGLKASHTEYFVPDDPAYYELTDLFSFAYRNRLRDFFPDGRVSYVGIGTYTTEIGGKLFVSGVLDGLPAAQAHVQPGDEIVAADQAPYDPIGSFAGKQGRAVSLTLRRAEGGPTDNVTVTPVEIRPAQAFGQAIEASARVIEHDGMKIAYVHMWCYFETYQRQLEQLLATKLAQADGLVWDLRGGWGGSADGVLDMFNPRRPTMEMTNRNGRPSLSDVKWTKPVVMLVDHGTRSAKEILAYGFKKYRIGEVVGSDTAGAVLASRGFLMKDGSLLLLAVAEVTVDGERLEGVGVRPTIPVDSPLPYRNGADPQLERALQVLSTQSR